MKESGQFQSVDFDEDFLGASTDKNKNAEENQIINIIKLNEEKKLDNKNDHIKNSDYYCNKVLNSNEPKDKVIDRSAAKTIEAVNKDKLIEIKEINPFYKLKSEDNVGQKAENTDLKKLLSSDDKIGKGNNKENTILSNNSKNENIIKIDEYNKGEDSISENEDENPKEKKEMNLKDNKNNIVDNSQKKLSEKINISQNESKDEQKQNYFINDPEIKMMRLSDMGNKSYLNSILRCLVSIKELKKYFTDKKEADIIYNSIKNKRLSFAIQRLFVHIYFDKKNPIYKPESIYNVLSENNKIFTTDFEINPNVCLTYILNQMHEELNLNKDKCQDINYDQYKEAEVIEKGKINFLQQNNSIISNTFSWYGKYEIICNSCSKRKYIFKSFFTFDLDISNFYEESKKNRILMYDCLEYATSRKILDKYYCETCDSLSEGKISKSIINKPKNFVFIIDRGNFEEKLMKINFILDNEINIKPFTENFQEPVRYQLNGIVSIIGKKYISFVKLENNWFVFDDSKIQKVAEKVVMNNDNNFGIKHIPCILFYKLVGGN